MINKAYLKIENIKDRKVLEKMLNEIYPISNLQWNNKICQFVTDGSDSFQLQMEKLLSMAIQDLGLQFSIFIVPFFDDLFIKYLNKKSNEVCTAFDVFVKNFNSKEVSDDAKKILGRISKQNLDTLKAFLSCNVNSCATASELYLHRNSFNYRMNHFIDATSIDIRDFNSLLFLKLILEI